jgi:hypothetical protein
MGAHPGAEDAGAERFRIENEDQKPTHRTSRKKARFPARAPQTLLRAGRENQIPRTSEGGASTIEICKPYDAIEN